MKRERLEILFDILSAISIRPKGAKTTSIIRKANINNTKKVGCLSELETRGMIRVNIDKHNRPTYIITNKGNQYITKFAEIKYLLGSN